MDDDNLRRLPTIIRGWTWTYGLLASASVLAAAQYVGIILGHPELKLPSPLNAMLYLVLATGILGTLMSRHAAKLRLAMATDRAEARMERAVLREGMEALKTALAAHERAADHRDGLMYRGVSRVRNAVGDVRSAVADLRYAPSPDRDTEQVQMGRVTGTAGVYVSGPAVAEVVELGARLTRHLSAAKDLDQ